MEKLTRNPIVSRATGVTIVTTKFHSQWFAVETEFMATRNLTGATSVQ